MLGLYVFQHSPSNSRLREFVSITSDWEFRVADVTVSDIFAQPLTLPEVFTATSFPVKD